MSIFERLFQRGRDGSGDRLHRAIGELVVQLRAEGRPEVADELERAWDCRKSPTTGWALLIDAIDSTDSHTSDT